MKSNFILSSENLHDIPFQKYDKDFTFIVNGKAYQTNRLIADILSPKIKQLHFTDSTINEYHINTKDGELQKSNQNDYFQDFLNLAYYQKTQIDSNQQKQFLEYFYLLGNITEYVHLIGDQTSEIMVDNAIDRLFSIITIESKMGEVVNMETKNTKEIITFIASHFEEIEKEQLKKLNLETLDEILRNDSLMINDEDSLLQFLITLYETNISYSYLFEYVLYCNVSQEVLEQFINTIKFDDMNSPIWKSICERLLHPNKSQERHIKDHQQNDKLNLQVNKKKQNFKVSSEFIEFHHDIENEFNGIMNYLSKETGSNIHDNGTIRITSDSVNNINYHPKNLVDYKTDALYYSSNKSDGYISFDFKDLVVQLDAYSIKSQANPDWGTTNYNLRNWVLEASSDGNTWSILDRHQNDSTLNGPNITMTYDIQNQNQFYRYVRIRLTGPNWVKDDDRYSNKYGIRLNCIEFYGKLKQK